MGLPRLLSALVSNGHDWGPLPRDPEHPGLIRVVPGKVYVVEVGLCQRWRVLMTACRRCGHVRETGLLPWILHLIPSRSCGAMSVRGVMEE